MKVNTSSKSSIRRLTVTNRIFTRDCRQQVFFPSINLSGKWLKDAGFNAGQKVNIAYEKKRFVVTILDE